MCFCYGHLVILLLLLLHYLLHSYFIIITIVVTLFLLRVPTITISFSVIITIINIVIVIIRYGNHCHQQLAKLILFCLKKCPSYDPRTTNCFSSERSSPAFNKITKRQIRTRVWDLVWDTPVKHLQTLQSRFPFLCRERPRAYYTNLLTQILAIIWRQHCLDHCLERATWCLPCVDEALLIRRIHPCPRPGVIANETKHFFHIHSFCLYFPSR